MLSQTLNSELSNAEALRGKVAVVKQGGLEVHEKARRAMAVGAIAVIVVNNASCLPVLDSTDQAADVVIPVLGVEASTLTLLRDGIEVTIRPVATVATVATGANAQTGNSIFVLQPPNPSNT